MATPSIPTNRQIRRARELTVHALILACAVWGFVAADLVSTGSRGRFSAFQKGNDFVQFYVAGSLARMGKFSALADAALFRAAQAPYFSPGDPSAFPPVYGPQVALAFAPLTWFSYLTAYAMWIVITLALTLGSVAACSREYSSLKRWPSPIAVAAFAYPPLGYLVLDGQLSGVGLGALTLGVLGLSRGRRRAAGAAIGLLGYKVSLLVPAVAVCVVAGEWTMAAIAGLVAALQLIVVLPFAGTEPVVGYLRNMWLFAHSPDLLAKNTYLMASFRTFWTALLPSPAAAIAYLVSGGVCVVVAGLSWRRSVSPVGRVGLLSIATVLCSPHSYIYDLVIVAPALVASSAILVESRQPLLRWCTWLAFLGSLAVPVAAFVPVQPITLVLAVWLVALARVLPVAPTRQGCANVPRASPCAVRDRHLQAASVPPARE